MSMTALKKEVINPLAPLPEQFDVKTIAECLSKLCRFNGHCEGFYTVAEHSCLVLELGELMAQEMDLILTKKEKLQFLLHDATEAYIGDVITPVKALIPEFNRIEKIFWKAITIKFEIEESWHALLDKADKIAYALEALQLRSWTTLEEVESHIPYKVPKSFKEKDWVRKLDIDLAEALFLSKFNELTKDDNIS